MDEFWKIKTEIERLIQDWRLCQSSEGRYRLEAYKELLELIDSLKGEPVSKDKDFEMALAEMVAKAQKCVVEPWVVAAQWKDELIKLASEEPISEELEEEIDNYVKRNGYDGLDSIEEVKYIANHFAKWQKEQFKNNRIKHCDNIIEEQMMNDDVEARILEVTGNDWEPHHLELYVDEKVLIEKGFKDGDKVKLLIIKKEE